MTDRHLHAVHAELNFEESEDGPPIVERSKHGWHFKSRDDNRESEQINLKYPANWLPRMMRVVKHDVTPFNSIQDFTRNAQYHYMLFMDPWIQDPEYTELMKLTIQQQAIDDRRSELKHRISVVEDGVTELDEAMAAKDHQMVLEAIAAGRETVATSRVDTEALQDKITDTQKWLEKNHD